MWVHYLPTAPYTVPLHVPLGFCRSIIRRCMHSRLWGPTQRLSGYPIGMSLRVHLQVSTSVVLGALNKWWPKDALCPTKEPGHGHSSPQVGCTFLGSARLCKLSRRPGGVCFEFIEEIKALEVKS